MVSASAERPANKQVVHTRPDAPIEEILELFERDRVLIIEDLADPETLGELQLQLEDALRSISMVTRDDDFTGTKTKRLGALVAKIPACRSLLIHPLIMQLVKGIMGRDASFQVNNTQAMSVQPGESPQPLHRDRWLWGALPLAADFEAMVGCMWAVSNFTTEGGATHVIPGSQHLSDPTLSGPRGFDEIFEGKEALLPDGRKLASLQTVQAEMTPGSALLYGGAIYHGAGANRSDRPRVGMLLNYSPAALRQEENQYLVTPPEVARHLPEELQKLLGYELGNYALGFVEGMKSPMTLLR